MPKTPQEVAEKWARRTAAASSDYAAGVQRVTQAPGAAAAAQQGRLLQRFTDSVQSGKWGQRVSSVSLADWQRAAIDKGAPRFAGGVQAAQPKMQDFMQQFLPVVESAKGKIAAMPHNNVEDGINRAATYIREVAKFRRR